MLDGRLAVDVPEAGALLGLSRNSAYAAAQNGQLPTLRVGRRLIVPVSALLELLNVESREEVVADGLSQDT